MYILYICLALLISTGRSIGALIPDTTVGPYYFLVFDDSIKTNYQKNGNPLPTRPTYAFLWSANADLIDMYQDTNPQMALSFYFPFSRDPDMRALKWWKNHHPTWLLYACDRETPARLEGDPTGPYVLDITNPDVIDWQVKTYAQVAAKQGYKFLATDNFALGNAVNGCGVFDVRGNWVQKYNGSYNDDNYSRDVTNWLQTFHTKVHALKTPISIALNFVIGGQYPTNELIQKVTNYTDAILDEAGVTQWGSGLNDEATWLNILNYMELIQSMGKAYLMINEFPTVDHWAKEYAMASYLLAKNQACAIVITGIQEYGIELYLPEYDNLRIGSPIGAKYKSNGLYWRKYTNATVVVNADTTNITFQVAQDSITAFGDRYPAGSSVTLGFHDGIVLAHTARKPK
eukprot:Phypoly_transcript_10253.p1 GENE.Phypoly_transcript_10253~~Phypoly_transcript_10253.p1  ORF type:complete len:402 (+),score=37.04 Phypoly_transcript_10253:20-1225(+)